MTKWLSAAAILFALVGAAAPQTPTSNAPGLTIRAGEWVPLQEADVYLPIVVLGHHVARMECGHLMLLRSGFVHIDWNRCAAVSGLPPGPPNASDATPAQIDEVVRIVRSLGFSASAIRSWTAIAPIGYDGFDTGAKTLRIGVVLVDVGPLATARQMLAKFDSANGPDVFDKASANVAYDRQLYLGPDCDTLFSQERAALIEKASEQARTLAAASGRRAAFAGMDEHHADDLLCPPALEPQIVSTDYSPPGLEDSKLFDLANASVHFTLSGVSSRGIATPAMPPEAAKLSAIGGPEIKPLPFDLPGNKPYAAMFGHSRIAVKADAAVIHYDYRIDSGTVEAVEADIGKLAAIGVSKTDVVEQRSTDGLFQHLHVFVRVRPVSLERVKEIEGVFKDSSGAAVQVGTFVRDCRPFLGYVLRDALLRSREKALVVSSVLNKRLRGLAASSVAVGSTTSCGVSPDASLDALAAAAIHQYGFGGGNEGNAVQAAFDATVDAAWTLQQAATERPAQFTEQSYLGIGTLQQSKACDEMRVHALRQAAESALVDGMRIWSIYERAPEFNYTTDADGCPVDVRETLTVFGV
jgi:hypothetical protein